MGTAPRNRAERLKGVKLSHALNRRYQAANHKPNHQCKDLTDGPEATRSNQRPDTLMQDRGPDRSMKPYNTLRINRVLSD
jgi:hypothetical protein